MKGNIDDGENCVRFGIGTFTRLFIGPYLQYLYAVFAIFPTYIVYFFEDKSPLTSCSSRCSLCSRKVLRNLNNYIIYFSRKFLAETTVIRQNTFNLKIV